MGSSCSFLFCSDFENDSYDEDQIEMVWTDESDMLYSPGNPPYIGKKNDEPHYRRLLGYRECPSK
ncbi:hypothetical protein TetV_589 [Tetraselmis virus 1]|uniref:Uncharacterized protein n=1 Tax=Tetraselmis virus 1 TaxID=2060617 RepID=A0A2P0VP49_9VIRU|nr:hypothetical protein QJ968_gp465 [Tetraselmis virus 1]AUF82671.1 hypothetical protein TetV_589 [Tetraselmis virus 1]